MAVGVIFTEIDLDMSKFVAKQKKLLDDIKRVGVEAEKGLQQSFTNLGVTSDAVYQLMANKAIASYNRIAASAKTSAAEQVRAHQSMVAKINALNVEMTKNSLFETLGIKSQAAYKAQEAAIISSYETIKKSGMASSEDLIRIERAKNEKLKELHKEMAGEHEMSMASMTRAVLRLYAAYYVLSQAGALLVVPFKKGFEAVESYNQSVASLAAMVVTFSELKQGQTLAEQWKSALTYSTAIVPVLEQIAARTLLSGQETTALANAFARSGVFIRANNAAQIEGFTRISNALPLMTKGQEIMRQINTEIRSVMTGQNEQSSMMLQTLKALPGFSKENLEIWRQQGTVLENVGKLLEGFGPATALLENQWQAVKSTIDTTVTQILRGGMLNTYGEIILSAKDLNKYLMENKDALIDGMSKWLGNFMLTMYSIQAEVMRLAMLLDKLGGTMSSAQMLLYGPGRALGVGSSTKRFEAAADRNINYENRYKETEKELEKLAIRYNNLEQSISAAGLAAAKLARSSAGGNEEFNAKPAADKSEKEDTALRDKLAEMTALNKEYYDDAAAKADHWLKMQKISGEGDLEATKTVINSKKIALTEWYHAQANTINQYVDSESKRAADLEKLWREYSRSWIKLENDNAEIAARITKKSEDDAIKAIEQEIELGMKLTKQSLDLPQKEADEARKMVTFYNDIRGMEEQYRNEKLNWIEKEAALKKSKGEEEVAVMKWVETQREMLRRENLKGIEEKFDYDNKYTKDTISNMGKVLDAAMSCYDKESSEYKRMGDLKKGVQIAEIAMEVAKNVQLLSFMVAQNAAYSATMAKKAAGLQLTAAEAVLTQGTGDPYSAFARIAAMMAIVAGVLSAVGVAGGFGGGGSSSVSSAPSYAFSDTVLGAAAGTGSESIPNTWELLQDTYDMEYRELRGIYNEMKTLNDNITGLVSNILRNASSIVSGEPFTAGVEYPAWWGLEDNTLGWRDWPVIGKVLGFVESIGKFVLGGLFGGETESSVAGSGLYIGGSSIANLISGGSVKPQSWTSVHYKKDRGWFRSDKEWTEFYYRELDGSVTNILNKVFQNIGQTIVSLTEELGGDLTAAMNYTFSAAHINLYGMDSTAINEALSTYFSNIADNAIQSILGSIISKYQEVGEGLMETATRLITDKAVILDTLEMTGNAYTGTASQAIELSEALIKLAGDLETLRKSAETYYDRFFDDSEKQVRLQEQLADVFTYMNMVLPSARAGYRAVVEGLDLTTDAGRYAYVTLLSLAESADAYYSAIEDLAEQRANMEIALMEAQGNAAGALAAKREQELAAMDESLRPLQEIIYLYEDLAKATSSASSSVREQISTTSSAASAARSAAVAYRNISESLQTAIDTIRGIAGPSGQSFRSLYAAGMTGDRNALSALPEAAKSYLESAKSTAATAQDYAREQGHILVALNEAKGISIASANWQDYQATLLETQVSVLQAIQEELIKPDPNTAILEQHAALLDDIGTLLQSGNTLTAGQTSEIITGNATSDVIRNLQNLNAAYSEGMLKALVENGGTQVNTMESVLSSTNETVSLLYQIVAMTKTSTELAEAAAAAEAEARAREAVERLAAEEAARQAAEEAARQAEIAKYNAQQAIAESYRSQWDQFATSRASSAFTERQENIETGTPYSVTGYYSYSDAERAWLSQTVSAYQSAFAAAYDLWKAIPGHATGLDYVPKDDYLMRAHEGEAVLSPPDAARWRSGKTGSNSNVILIEEIRALRAEIKAGNVAIAKNTGKAALVLDRTLTKWDEQGIPAEATP